MKPGVVKRRKMKDNPFSRQNLQERMLLLMTHDTPSHHASAPGTDLGAKLEHLLLTLPAESATAPRKRGRPVELPAWHLSLAVVVCLLRGLQSQLEVWRLIAFAGVGPLAPLPLSDQAVYDRLDQDGVSAFQAFFGQLSAWLAQRLAPYEDCRLAPFAAGVVALDESVLDQVKRWVKWLREVPAGDSRLLPVRLVCFRVGKQRYSYLTNVLDPATLSIADIARLYARRWDIELAFRELKDHLGLHLLWSAKLGVIYQQIWASLILAQLLHAFQVELAARAEVDPFDVSLYLLSRQVPALLLRGEDPMGFLLTHGRAMGLIRPSTRTRIQAPIVPLQEVFFPPPEVLQPRKARSAHRNCGSRYAAQS